WVDGLAVGQVEPRQVEGASEGAGREEALVELEVLVAADALRRGELAALVDHEHLICPVDDHHLHLAVGELVDAEQVDPSHPGRSISSDGMATARAFFERFIPNSPRKLSVPTAVGSMTIRPFM